MPILGFRVKGFQHSISKFENGFQSPISNFEKGFQSSIFSFCCPKTLKFTPKSYFLTKIPLQNQFFFYQNLDFDLGTGMGVEQDPKDAAGNSLRQCQEAS